MAHPLKSAVLYEGSSDKLCTSMSFLTKNYFLSGLVSRHISYWVQKEFRVIQTLSRDRTLKKVL